MFTRFATVLHNAVDALAPPLPAKEEFVYHWKCVTNFFVDRKSDSKAPIEHTNIPSHLNQMLSLLLEEESVKEADTIDCVGPCVEYLLQHKILDTLQALARADFPPGMKQHVLLFMNKLVSSLRQPLFPHVSIYKPINQFIRICGEVKAGPTEMEEILFLENICSRLKVDLSLINLFLEVTNARGDTKSTELLNNSIDMKHIPDFVLVNSLLTLSQSADTRISFKACNGLLFCAKACNDIAAQSLIKKTKFTQVFCERLVVSYNSLSKTMNPDLLDHVEAKWGEETGENLSAFPGKRQVVSFLSWLDFCDKVIQSAYPLVGETLAEAIHGHFLRGALEPALCQVSESGAILATAILIKSLQQISAQVLIKEFGYFLFGESIDAEIHGVIQHPIKHLLLERCSFPNDEVILITLKLFDAILDNPTESVLHNLVLSNLLTRNYYDTFATDYQSTWSDEEDARTRRRHYEELDISPGSSPISRTMAPSNIHRIINCFLCLLPDELKSCDQDEEMGYDSYIRDAHRQFQDCSLKCESFDWPSEAVSFDDMHHSDSSSSESQAEADRQISFYEGSFLAMLLDKVEAMLDQSYEVSLQITSMLSKLALFPHPNLHEFLLNPVLPVPEGCRTLCTSLLKVAESLQVRIYNMPKLKRKLYLTRRVLLGDNTEYNSVEGSTLLEGIIVLEEFCKELAAITFVKYHAAS